MTWLMNSKPISDGTTSLSRIRPVVVWTTSSFNANVDQCMDMQLPRVVGNPHFFRTGEAQAFALAPGQVSTHVVEAQNDVLGGPNDRATRCRTQDIIRRHHEHARFDLGFHRKRNVNSHLVAVESPR